MGCCCRALKRWAPAFASLATSQRLGRPFGLAGFAWGLVNSMTYGLPTKRSVTIAGHETSISLEPLFWAALESAAAERGLPLNAVIAEIDVERLDSVPPPNLTSAIRQWLFARCSSLGGGKDRAGE